jgi:hypothetical protein
MNTKTDPQLDIDRHTVEKTLRGLMDREKSIKDPDRDVYPAAITLRRLGVEIDPEVSDQRPIPVPRRRMIDLLRLKLREQIGQAIPVAAAAAREAVREHVKATVVGAAVAAIEDLLVDQRTGSLELPSSATESLQSPPPARDAETGSLVVDDED